MQYNIETHLQERVDDPLEECRENIEVFKRAGLDSLVEELEEDKVYIPFLLLTAPGYNAIKHFYYYKKSPASFDKPIPLQVASLLALCKEKEYFKTIQIYSESDNINPFFTSYALVGTSNAGDEMYLIARWSLQPLPELESLADKARPLVAKRFKQRIARDLAEKQKDLDNLDELVDKHMRGEYTGYYF